MNIFGVNVPWEYFFYTYLFNAIMLLCCRIGMKTLPQRMVMYRHYLEGLSAEELDREATRLSQPH